MLQERDLQVARGAVHAGEALDRLDDRTRRLRRRNKARLDLASADPHRAGAAVPGLAADLRPDEAEIVAQDVGQAPHRLRANRHRAPVDPQRDRDVVTAPSREHRLERPTDQRQRRVAAVLAGAADVVDRRQSREVLRACDPGRCRRRRAPRELRLQPR